MNPITLDAIKLMVDLQSSNLEQARKDEALSIVTKLLLFLERDIDAVLERTSKILN